MATWAELEHGTNIVDPDGLVGWVYKFFVDDCDEDNPVEMIAVGYGDPRDDHRRASWPIADVRPATPEEPATQR